MSEAQRKHKITEVIEFGEALIRTGDLDPVYIALYAAGLPGDQMRRLLLAYFCFYHLGAAARLSEMEGESFWALMETAAENNLPPSTDDLPGERWPRGTERRHFRGQKCVDAVRRFEKKAPNAPEEIISALVDELPKPLQLVDIINYIQGKWPMCGAWLAFKAADILERVLGVPIVFPNDLTLFYKEPRAALDMLIVPAEQANAKLLKHFSKFMAPPKVGRRCNIQEVETVCCKWKSGVNGHYWIGKDIHEIRNALKGWGDTAEMLLRYMPKEVEQGLFKC